MDTNRKLYPWELALLLSLCVSLLCGVWAGARQTALAGRLVRLHVIAASDSNADQAEKLRVRDAVLDYLTPLLADVTDIQDAQKIIEHEQPNIAKAAACVTGQKITVTFGQEHYPTREYDTFSLPAGTYPSLRVTLGSGAGHNWWCVIFPPLCVESALDDRAVEALSQDDVRLITEDGTDYVVKFRILEIWDSIAEALK